MEKGDIIMFDEKDKIVINIDGESKDFYKLFTFYSKKTDKDYIVYIDKNEPNTIYSSIVINKDNHILLEKIEDEEDIEETKKAMIEIKLSISNNESISGEVEQ